MLAAYTFGDVMWSMFVFFAWILFFWMLFVVFGDLFGRHDVSGWAKAGWTLFVIILPFLGIFVYLIAEGKGMGERSLARAQAQQSSTTSSRPRRSRPNRSATGSSAGSIRGTTERSPRPAWAPLRGQPVARIARRASLRRTASAFGNLTRVLFAIPTDTKWVTCGLPRSGYMTESL